MHKIMDFVCEELEGIDRKAETGKLSMAEIEYANKLAQLKKNLMRTEEGNSYDGNSEDRGSYRRDSRGRYAEDYRGSSRRYSSEGDRW
jgi:hypothetical protein